MINANDNRNASGQRIELDCWLEGGSPYLVSVFDPNIRPEPVISEMFDTAGAARVAAGRYARIHGIAHIYDMTGDAA